MDVKIRPLREEEATQVLTWAREEGWEISHSDVIRFIRTQPGSFFAAELHEKCVGCITAFKQGDYYGMIGYVLVKKEYRGQGIGRKLLEAAKQHLEWSTIRNVGVDSREHVTGMYAKVGFKQASWDVIHYTGKPQTHLLDKTGASHYHIQHIKDVNFNELIKYDTSICWFNREVFWKLVLENSDKRGYAALVDGEIVGFGVIRPVTKNNHSIAPLYANNRDIANILLKTLITSCKVVRVTIDTHGESMEITDLLKMIGLKESYRLKRLYSQKNISYELNKVWAIPDTDISII